MYYVIKNSKDVYIKLDDEGRAVTCPEHEKGVFEYTKARNIVRSLKKTLQRLHFSVVPVYDANKIESNQPDQETKTEKKNVIESEKYELPENISALIEKVGTCFDVLNEARQRKEILTDELKKTEDELLDILHRIELESAKDLYGGWLLYKQIRNNRKQRREIKDEIFVIQKIFEEVDLSCLDRKRIRKVIKKLFGRKYTYRIIEEENQNDM